MENYLPTMKEFLEVDSIELENELSSFDNWDSMTVLMIIDFSSTEYGIILSADEIENSHTVLGLKKLIESKL
ncbi:acyl carrier protein [Maribacter sp. PR1]|uniref:Acyl carrier protein n=1 Tax=Maribacter cobaltidurans TaxID=1178778 RepID=A0ABU7IWI6_9FLAO|nr:MULTISPECIES: acyl carrier protein [Maribacter]MDC6389766.1 acyl carrier protein [Maribacter sp. PR1]MEE1977156.1 acyl carrier protein [Maribacter cobaltidurans]